MGVSRSRRGRIRTVERRMGTGALTVAPAGPAHACDCLTVGVGVGV
jgi:hypothetical protein